MYIDISKLKSKSGKIYIRYLLRKSYREKGKVKKKTIANLSGCNKELIEALVFASKHKDQIGKLKTLLKE